MRSVRDPKIKPLSYTQVLRRPKKRYCRPQRARIEENVPVANKLVLNQEELRPRTVINITNHARYHIG